MIQFVIVTVIGRYYQFNNVKKDTKLIDILEIQGDLIINLAKALPFNVEMEILEFQVQMITQRYNVLIIPYPLFFQD